MHLKSHISRPVHRHQKHTSFAGFAQWDSSQQVAGHRQKLHKLWVVMSVLRNHSVFYITGQIVQSYQKITGGGGLKEWSSGQHGEEILCIKINRAHQTHLHLSSPVLLNTKWHRSQKLYILLRRSHQEIQFHKVLHLGSHLLNSALGVWEWFAARILGLRSAEVDYETIGLLQMEQLDALDGGQNSQFMHSGRLLAL